MKLIKVLWSSLVLVQLMLCMGCAKPSEPQVQVLNYKIGDVIIFDKQSLTVNTVQIAQVAEHSPKQEIVDPNTNTWLVHITVSNKSKKAFAFWLNNLVIQDSTGKIYEGHPSGIGSQLATTRYLPMGDIIKGTVVYTVKKGAQGLKIVYQPSSYPGYTYVVPIS